jgi:hypothetical protein
VYTVSLSAAIRFPVVDLLSEYELGGVHSGKPALDMTEHSSVFSAVYFSESSEMVMQQRSQLI